MIQHLSQALPPVNRLVTAIGNQHNFYVETHSFKPGNDVNQVSTVDWITVVATKSNFANLCSHICANLIFEKIKRQLLVQQVFGNFGTWAPGASQCTDAG
jgi:hypothetical protein